MYSKLKYLSIDSEHIKVRIKFFENLFRDFCRKLTENFEAQ
jgi:hypothetical protein